jgi:hypothetical protein
MSTLLVEVLQGCTGISFVCNKRGDIDHDFVGEKHHLSGGG